METEGVVFLQETQDNLDENAFTKFWSGKTQRYSRLTINQLSQNQGDINITITTKFPLLVEHSLLTRLRGFL